MKPGDRVLGRFTLLEELPAPHGQVRWAARDETGAGLVDVVSLTGRVALRPGAAAHFERAQVRPADAPGALLAVGEQGQIGTRPASTRPSAAPVDPELVLGPDQVRAWAAWLLPAALAAETQLAGELSPADLVVDEDGILRLAPAGLRPATQEVQPPHHRAPEVLAGGPTAPGSALFGLGVLLFRAATGTWPRQARSAAALAQAGPARRASSIVPDMPQDIDELLATLLDLDPSRRLTATVATPEPVSADALAWAGPTAAVREPVPPVVTTRESSVGSAEANSAAWVVVVEPGQLTGAARSRAAAMLDIDDDTVTALVDAGLPLPVAESAGRSEAVAKARALTEQGLPAVAREGGSASGPALAAARSGTGGALAGVLAVLLGLSAFLLGPLALAPALVLALIAGTLGVLAGRSAAEARERSRLDEARRRLVADNDDSPMATARAAVRQARRAVLDAELPAPVRLDLEGAADEIAEELDAVQTREGDSLSAEVIEELEDLTALAREIEASTAARIAPERSQGLGDRVRARTAAARAAALELRRR